MQLGISPPGTSGFRYIQFLDIMVRTTIKCVGTITPSQCNHNLNYLIMFPKFHTRTVYIQSTLWHILATAIKNCAGIFVITAFITLIMLLYCSVEELWASEIYYLGMLVFFLVTGIMIVSSVFRIQEEFEEAKNLGMIYIENGHVSYSPDGYHGRWEGTDITCIRVKRFYK